MPKTRDRMEEVPGRGLLDTLFSWSINDVLNKNLYQKQVKKIPETFPSMCAYMRSFVLPLLEETRADLLSSIKTVSKAPVCQISSVSKAKKFQSPSDFFYHLSLLENGEALAYKPVVGDLIAITNVRPKGIDDLNNPKNPYVIAFVHRASPFTTKLTVLSSKLITANDMDHKKKETVFAVYLTNMTTNIRIWRSLNRELKGNNMKIIDKVLQVHSSHSETCAKCLGNKSCIAVNSQIRAKICHSDLNDSQRAAVQSCISLRECHHQNTVKLIWGPPGTGKTTAVGLMLYSLLKLKCRTLTCAPTNVAILEVAKRLLREVKNKEFPRYDCYQLGDIILFGPEEQMKIDDDHNHDLRDVFLNYRVIALRESLRGWKQNLASMISLLEDPRKQYTQYLKEIKTNQEQEERHKISTTTTITGVVEGRIEGKKQEGKKLSGRNKEDGESQSQEKKNEQETAKSVEPLTFVEFLSKRFDSLNEHLTSCILNLCTHLPTSFLSRQVVMKMFRVLDLLRSLKKLFNSFSSENEVLKQMLYDLEDKESGVGCLSNLRVEIKECLQYKLLPKKFSTEENLRELCLANACLIFCTVSSTAKLHKKGMSPIEILVVDEATQLKECESTIPMQLSGIRHTILIGDEKQLPAMVQSKISKNAEFGRSLFERLVRLGHKKHLFNVQHRMHPSISLFPNMEFYERKILDGQNVKEKSYERNFLPGKMYGSYSFVNVSYGKEECDDSSSQRNMVEASIVSEIVKKLHEEYVRTKKKVRVGVISPYKAQVHAIEEKVKRYAKVSGSESGDFGFEVNVSSVDGFQGGEEDVIIISTVRCNDEGSIGFLSDQRRVNVALTRARHCLWIVGNETTLRKSNSVWKQLVIDANVRGCFYNAEDDKSLAWALLCSLIELNEVNTLQNVHPSLFTNAGWKVRFDDGFWHSMGRVGNRVIIYRVFSLLEKLSNGWHRNYKRKMFVHHGISYQPLEQYKVNGSLTLVWTVDILEENLECIQAIMIRDILTNSDIQKIAKRSNISDSDCVTVKIDQCKYECIHGELVIPMRRPADSSNFFEVQDMQLSKSPASLKIADVSKMKGKNLQVKSSYGAADVATDTIIQKSIESTFSLKAPKECETHSEVSGLTTSERADATKSTYQSVGFENSFAFKFEDLNGGVHQFNGGVQHLDGLVSRVMQRVDHVYDRERLVILYEDDKGDKIPLSTDNDLVAAVSYARSARLKALELHLEFTNLTKPIITPQSQFDNATRQKTRASMSFHSGIVAGASVLSSICLFKYLRR